MDTSTAARAGRKEWLALVALTLPPLLVSMDITVLYFAVPSISASLKPTSVQQLWMIDVYGFVLAGMLITMGNIGDVIGRRRLLLMGAALFGAASAAAAWSTSPEMIIAMRAVQGLAAATLMPSALALVRTIFHDEKQRRSAIGIWSASTAIGAGLGPVLSGVLLNNFWWGSIFLINVPVVVLLLVTLPALAPEHRLPKEQVGSFDVTSAVLSIASVLSLIWGIKEWAANGYSNAYVGAIVVAVVIGVLFLFRQGRMSHPMIDPALFKHRGFGAALLLSITAFFCTVGFSLFSTQYFMEVLNMRPLTAALWTLIAPALAMVLVPVGTQLANKVRPAYIIAVGFLVTGAGFVAMTQLSVQRNLPLALVGIAGIGVGTTVVLAIMIDLVVAVAPANRVGSVAALQKVFQEFGGAFGIAIFGAIGAAVYGRTFDDQLPSGVAGNVPKAAGETIGAAVQSASHLPNGAATAVVHAARVAFTDALTTSAFLGIAVAVLSAVVAVLRLGHVSYADGAKPDSMLAEALGDAPIDSDVATPATTGRR